MPDKPVIWITRNLSENTIERAQRDYTLILNPLDQPHTPETIVAMSSRVDGIIPCHSEHFTRDVVVKLDSRVRIIANHSVGVDHCDLPALEKRGIVVTNTPDVLSDATAEIAILLLLGAARRAIEGDTLVRSRQWKGWSPSFMVGRQVTGKRLGIVGMGSVGQVVAERARGFEMEIHYHNRKRLPDHLERGAVYHNSIESLLPVSDFLSLHCPATAETGHLINKRTLALMSDGSLLINTARGALVNETDLIDALDAGKLGAAGLDCFATEPGGNPALSAYPNVFMLPHIGSATTDTRDAMGFRALDNLDAFFAGETPCDKLV